MPSIDRVLDVIASLFRVLVALCLAIMLTINIVNIIWRGTFDQAFSWVFSWTMLLFVWMLTLGLFLYIRDGRDVVVDIFATRLPPAPRRVLAVASDLVGICVMLVILRGAPDLIRIQTSLMETIALPIWVRSAPLFLSSSLVLVHFLNHAIALIKGNVEPFPRQYDDVVPEAEPGAIE